jgi:nitrile hydratase beta subunit
LNGVHDMGGMHGMGPIEHENNEPVFHARWERRIFGLYLATGAWRKWTIEDVRYQRELIPPSEYLRSSYYEKWLAGLVELLVNSRLVTRDEIQRGRPERHSPKATPALHAKEVPMMIAKGFPASRNLAVGPLFQVGQRVRARNINPVGHTRLPRYARGKLGTIEQDHGVYVFPDTNAQNLGEKPQHVYSVRFGARELWGEQAAPQDAAYVAMWDDYLEPA